MQTATEAGQAPDRAGTPQAAGVSYADMLAGIKAQRALPVLAAAAHAATRYERKFGEGNDQQALRIQIDEQRPALASGIWS